MLKPDTLRPAILGVLQDTKEPLTGAQVFRALNTKKGRIAVYQLLWNLEDHGLVLRNAHKQYRLSAYGRRYTDWLRAMPTH